MLGLCIGIVSGVIQFKFLAGFINTILGGGFGPKDVTRGIISFFIPLLVLTAVAFLRPAELAHTGAGMAAALILLAVIKFIRYNKQAKNSSSEG